MKRYSRKYYRQPQGAVQPNPVWLNRNLELLTKGSDVPWVKSGRITSWLSGGSTFEQGTSAAGASISNAESQFLTRNIPVTVLVYGVVLGTLSTGAYPSILSQPALNVSNRGGIELGVGGDLGAGSADVGRIYLVNRSNTFPGNETLVKTTNSITSGVPFVVVGRLSSAGTEIISTVGSATNPNTASIGINNTDDYRIAPAGSPAAHAFMTARFASFLTDKEVQELLINPWQLFDDRVIYLPSFIQPPANIPSILALTPSDFTSSTFRPRYILDYSGFSNSLDFSEPDNSGYINIGTGVK